ncbi:flavin-containing monooxygenase 1 isoform X2 [Saccopteryx bilineata]|uniref:flavin-containing monooxygenase 1 isoform X2 n=1 Tax=Saccopteryx bilineata TaxID=59482 RepID=UPI00338EECAB
MAKRVAIVGAGVSGLASIKCCLEEGLEPTCFERSNDLGGLWRFTEHVEEGRASLYKSVVSNSCKEMSCYSDFPFPEDYPNYVPNSQFLEYLKMYANQFNLLKYIQFKVFLSTTGGAWVMSRISTRGLPWDMVFMTRFQNMFRNSLPTPIVNWWMARNINSWFNHAHFGLMPEDRTQLKEPVINDELPGRIITGKVLIKPSIKEVKENSVIFKCTSEEQPIDIIVFATGYTFAFPFLDEAAVKVEDGQASLYKYIFPAHLEKPTLAVIGLIKPLGSMIPTGETQARWAVRVLKGVNKLPPQSVMIEEVNARKENRPNGFGLCYCKALQSDYITYIDDLLTYINAKPNLLSLLLTDPRLALTVFFGPCTPYQFRLTGPGKWKGARNAILTQWDRTFNTTKTRTVQESPFPFASLLTIFLVLLAAIFLVFL